MKTEKILILLILASITAFVLVPFINTGLAEGDDAEFFLSGVKENPSSDAASYAKSAGRFYFLITKPLYNLPYKIKSLTVIKTVNILLLLLILILASGVIKQLFKSKWLAYLSYLLLLTFISVKGNNNPIISFQWYFTGSFLLIIASVLFALKYGETKKKYFRIYSIALYALGLLFYEDYILYLPIVMLASVNLNSDLKNTGLKTKLINVFKASLPFIITAILYIASYFSFRIFYPANYNGTSFANSFKIIDGLDTVFGLARGAYPCYFFFFGKTVFWDTSILLRNHIQNLGYVLETANYLWYIKAIVTGILSYLFLSNTQIKNIGRILIILIVAILYIYIPHIPLALTEKYTYLYPGMDNYITTFFAFFSVIFVLTIIFSLVSFIKNKIIKKILIILIVVAISIGSILTDYINFHAVKGLQHPANTLNCMNKLIATNEFNSIPDNSFVYSPMLYSNADMYGFAYSRFKWGEYVYHKINKKIKFAANKEELIQAINSNIENIYYLRYDYNKKDIDQFIALGSISKESIIDSVNSQIFSNKVTCFYYSAHKDFSISFAYNNVSDTTQSYLINNKKYYSQQNQAYNNYKYHNKNQYFMPIVFEAKNIDMNSFNISNLSNLNQVDVIIN
jgi:hypothetical protein